MEEAGKWLGSLKLGRVLDGKTIDLTDAAKSLPFEGRFREMIFESARRKLKKRGARDVIVPPVTNTEATFFIIRPHRRGWQCFEAPGVQPFFTESDGRQHAIDYAKGRTSHRYGEIRVFNAAGQLEESIAFDERTRKL